MKKYILFSIMLFAVVFLTSCGAKKASDNTKKNSKDEEAAGWELADKIVSDVNENTPEFADYEVDVEEFGGIYLDSPLSDSDADKERESQIASENTKALNKAMAQISSNTDEKSSLKGGKLIIHDGYFYCGPITFESNVNLFLDKNATVCFTTDTTLYPNVLTRWEGVVCYNYSPFIYAYQKENIAITGEGTFDGQASKEKYWLPWKNGSLNPKESQSEAKKKIRQMGEEQTPVEDRVFGEGSYLRPSFLQPYECNKVLVQDITIKNAPFWMVHPVFCSNVAIRGVTVNSFGYNNDGINPDSCNNVLIENCVLNTGDDAIAIKSGLNKDGYTIGIPSENIVVRNNTYLTGKGSAATVGSDMSGDVRNIYFMDSKSEDTCDHLQSISIKTNGDRGGTIENIYISGLESASVEDYAVYMTMEYEEGDTKKTTPSIHNIYIKDCKLTGGDKGTIGLIGYDRSPIKDIYFENCTFTNCKSKFTLWNVENITLKNCTFDGEKWKDGVIQSVADNIEINDSSVSGDFITINYSVPAKESDFTLQWYCSDEEMGDYVPVTEKEVENVFNKNNESRAKILDKTKYYKLGIKLNESEFLSKAYHY